MPIMCGIKKDGGKQWHIKKGEDLTYCGQNSSLITQTDDRELPINKKYYCPQCLAIYKEIIGGKNDN